MEKTARIRISQGGWDLEFAPALGGAVTQLSYDLKPVFRSVAAGEPTVLETGCFPLVPYCNRIAHGRFHFEGQDYQIPPNHDDHPHSLNGLGWQSEWKVMAAENDLLSMVHRHDGGAGWPWPYIAGQEAEIDGDAVNFCLSLRNDGTTPMPAGLGFHPFFIRREDTRLTAKCRSVWLTDSDCIPVSEAPADHFSGWSTGAPVHWPDLIDNCYAGWDGLARIEQPADGFVIIVSASPELRHFHLFISPDADYFCAGPASHMPDALNRAHPGHREGLQVLLPGETMTADMRISLEEI